MALLLSGILFALYAKAYSNGSITTGSSKNLSYDLQKSTLFNTSGIPNESDYETYLEAQRIQEVKRKQIAAQNLSFDPCSCVSYVRWKTGINVGSIGAAKNWPVNSQIPEIGSVIVTYESSWGHVALITGIEDGNLILSEANYNKCKQTNGRKLPINSKLIKGFYINK